MRTWVELDEHGNVTTSYQGDSIVPSEHAIEVTGQPLVEVLTVERQREVWMSGRRLLFRNVVRLRLDPPRRRIVADGEDTLTISLGESDVDEVDLRIGGSVVHVTREDPAVLRTTQAGIIVIESADPKIHVRRLRIAAVAPEVP